MNKRKSLIVFLAIGLVLGLATVAWAASTQPSDTIYVDAETGSDVMGNGSELQPYRSIIYAVETNTQTQSNTIHVDDGVYTPGSVTVDSTNYSLPIKFNDHDYTLIFGDWQTGDHGDLVIKGENKETALFSTTNLSSGRDLTIRSVLQPQGDGLVNKAVLKNVGSYPVASAGNKDVDTAAILLEGASNNSIDIFKLNFLDTEIGVKSTIEHSDLQIYKNSFSESASNRYDGIKITSGLDDLDGSRKEIYENTFENLSRGVYISNGTIGSSNPVNIVNNTFGSNTRGIQIDNVDEQSLFVNYNQFLNNQAGVVTATTDANNKWNFDYNWWGDKAGPLNPTWNPYTSGDSLITSASGNLKETGTKGALTDSTSQYWFSHKPEGDITLESSPSVGPFNVFNTLTRGNIDEPGAIDNAVDGDTVYVNGGKTYSVSDNDELIKTSSNEVSILRQGGDRANTVLDAGWYSDSTYGAIYLESAGDQLGSYSSSGNKGFTVVAPQGTDSSNDYTAIFSDVNDTSEGVKIEGNRIENGFMSIELVNEVTARIVGNELVGDWNGSPGYQNGTKYGIFGSYLRSSSLIKENIVKDIGLAGIRFDRANVVTIKENEIFNIGDDSPNSEAFHDSAGVYLRDEDGQVNDIDILNNEIYGVNTVLKNGVGIRLEVTQTPSSAPLKHVYVEHNTIRDNDIGLGINQRGKDADPSWNHQPSYIFVNNNDIYDNSQYGAFTATEVRYLVNQSPTPKPLDALSNWWGSSTGPQDPDENTGGNGDKTSADVDVTPWLTSPYSANLTITATSGNNGSISPSGAVAIQDGGSQTFTIDPDSNYQIADVTVDGSSVMSSVTIASDGTGTYEFTNVTSDHSINATFSSSGSGTCFSVSGGWNLVSMPVNPSDTTPSAVFDEVTGDLYVYEYAGGDTWNTVQNGNLTSVGPLGGYYLWLPNDTTLTEVCTAGSDVTGGQSVSLDAGWNLIGVPYEVNWNDDGTLSLTDGSTTYNLVEAANNGWITTNVYELNGDGQTFTPTELGQGKTLQPGQGYWIYTETSGLTLNYSETGGPSGGPPTPSTSAVSLDEVEGVSASPPVPAIPSGSLSVDSLQVSAVTSAGRVTFKVTGEGSNFVSGLKVEVFDASGRKIKVLESSGNSASWDAGNAANGVYMYAASANVGDGLTRTNIGKLLLLK